MNLTFLFSFYLISQAAIVFALNCGTPSRYGNGPPSTCAPLTDPNNLPKSQLEDWFTETMFEDLFPRANLGWGPNECFPYSYESFMIAARYFPDFGTSSTNTVYNWTENTRRDVAAFFAHTIQETGENNAAFYSTLPEDQADDCFYRGGFYEWFEGGPTSSFLNPQSPGYQPQDGNACTAAGRYCEQNSQLTFFYPCNTAMNGSYFEGCYFGRGALQISYNYNYGAFQNFLASKNITVDLLTNPNLVLTHRSPPLAFLASLWFYMTPQPPKPAMHDIILGNWNAGAQNIAAGYSGPIFGPTSLVINNECSGMSATAPGGPGENRRIRAFIWFTSYFGVPAGDNTTLTCQNMPVLFDSMSYNISYQPDWSSTWKPQSCQCAPASYGGIINYYDPAYYPSQFVAQNPQNMQACIASLYANPSMYNLNPTTDACLGFPPSSSLVSSSTSTKLDASTTRSSTTESFVTTPSTTTTRQGCNL